MTDILVVDDQISFCDHIKVILETEGYEVDSANEVDSALKMLSQKKYEILLTDYRLGPIDGIELFKKARQLDDDISGVMMTAYASIDSAIQSIKDGFNDYIQKPFEPDILLISIKRIIRERKMAQEIRLLRKEVIERYSFHNIVGKHKLMQNVFELINKVSGHDARVMITGETGVGKELVAKAIHYNSRRKDFPFVGINCAGLTESLLESELFGYEKGAFTGADKTKKGKFEYADGGTLFLDEVGDISSTMQIKLLRVLQENKFERVGGNKTIDANVRIISATNQELDEKIKKGDFRVELYYRLNIFPIKIPALRDRIEDIPILTNHFINKFNKKYKKSVEGVSTKVMKAMMHHSWPGNVRELENLIEREFVTIENNKIEHIDLSGTFIHNTNKSIYDVDVDLPFKIAKSLVVNRFEKAYLKKLLKGCMGNVNEAARKSKINPRTLWRKIQAFNLELKEFSSDE
ncbi:Transcriptional regulatory protein ZraR [Desulfosarcina cetonica]|uniref:sigma-54-dependent transcriptional regulator n=1 Tax=Desulfosarcina cetonica TaxID=90730 RepID=UPI0006D24219|nr:sigma-54 dependent transcriptional regulator [Desulfosarcina cetonica]VTR69097.1 Transcriptional regulatory protein ZraR [Desulfosarcina cetonica]